MRLFRNARAPLSAAMVLVSGCVVPPGSGAGPGAGVGSGDAGAGQSEQDGACARTKCDPLECGSGLLPLPLPGECCPTVCVPSDCSTVDCPPVECPAGTHQKIPAGTCCATCARDTPATGASGSCEDGQAGYQAYLATLLAAADVSSCNADSDCRLVRLDNTCGASCGTAVSVRGGSAITSAANAYAAAHCAACPPSTPCPPVEQFALCSGGGCTAHSLLAPQSPM